MDTATYTLLLDFGEGYEDFSDRIIMAESYKPRICIGKAGAHEIQTVQLKLHQAAGLSARLLTATNPIPAKLLRLETPVMTGVVRPFVSTKALLNRMDPISISILDMSATLEQYVFDSQRWTNFTLVNRSDVGASLIHKLFLEAGVPSSDVLVDFDRSEIIPCYSLSNGDYISDRIQEALYEYGLTYRATENGQYRILDISQDTIIPDVTLYSEDLRNELLPSRNDSSQKGAVVKWYPVLTRSQVPVFAYEFTEETEDLPGNGVFPPSSDVKGYRLPYDISELTDGKLLAIDNPVLSYKPNTLNAYTITDFGPDDCSAYLVSTSSSKQTISEFQVLADVWYQGRTYSQQVAQGEKPKTYTAKVISDAGSAQRLARILATRQTVGQQQYSFESFVILSPGQLVRIYEYKVSHIDTTVRILSREYDSMTGLYQYSAEGTADIDLTISVSEIETIENALGKGRRGPKGDTGNQGPKGDKGDRGLQGLQGDKGDKGIPGDNGTDGLTAYSHIAYADNASGGGFSQSPTGKTYIGFYADHTEADSTNPSDYNWSLIKGADGAQGIQGPKGTDGLTAYFHTAWANNETGTSGFSTTVSSGKLYIGTYSDFTAADSTDPTKYKWVKIKGEPGSQGPQGIQGPSGADGQSLYTWVAYANDANGTGISASSTNKPYVGFAYNKITPTMTLTPSLFTWARIEGPQGVQGATGSTGAQGVAGLNQATIHLYQRKSTQPAVTDIADPITYTFASGAISGTLGSWTTAVPTGTDPLWVTIAVAIGNGTTDTIARSEWSTPAKMAQDGATGATGATGAQGNTGAAGASGVNTAVVYLYRRGASSPAKPSTASTYTFATGVLTGHNNSWTQAVPATDGNPLWVIQATASATAPTATASIPAASWGTQIKMVLDGATGATLYTWLKYADSPTSGMSDLPDGKPYIGLAYNKTTPTESTNYSDYQWTRIKGDPGTPARDFEITATPSIYELSARGVILKDETIMLSCTLLNIPAGTTISWELLDADYELGALTGEQSSIFLTEGYAPPLITVQCTVTGFGSKTLTIPAVRLGLPQPRYFGVLSSAPSELFEGEPIIEGDYYLGTDNLPYYYLSGNWVIYGSTLPRWDQAAMTMMADATAEGKTIDTQSILHLWVKNLVVDSGAFRELFAQTIELDVNGMLQSKGFDPNSGDAGFQIKGSGESIFKGVTIKANVSASTVDSDTLKTFKEELATNTVSVTNIPSAWNIPSTFQGIFGYYNKQPEDMMTVGAGSTYKGKAISKVGISVNSKTTLLYQDGTRSRGFKDNSAYWLDYTLNQSMLGSAYKAGQTYRITVSTSFGGDWADQTIEQWRGGVEIRRLGSGRDTSLSVDTEVMAGDVIRFWGKNSAWPIFGTKTMYVYAFSVYSVKAGTAPHISETSTFSNVSKSNAGASWVTENVGTAVTIPLGARNIRLRYSSYSIAGGTSMGSHYYLRVVIDGVERATNYTLGARYTTDIPVPEGASVQLRMYIAPRFTITTKDDENNDVTTTYTPAVTISSPRITLVGESTKGIMIIHSDDTSDFIPYAGLNNSEYTEHILDIKSSSEFPHNISPILSKYTLTAIKEEFEVSGFSNGSVIMSAVDDRPTLNVNGTPYTVNRIFVFANHVIFSTTAGDVYVYDFASNKAVYETLTLSTVTPVAQKGENRTKHINPLETLKYSVGDRAGGLLFDKISAREGDFDRITLPQITGAVTTDQTTNSITLSGIASALSLQVGDVIEIVGDKIHTVESITNNNTIVVNYEHCGNRGNGPLKVTTLSGVSTTVRLLAKWYNAPLGLGQAWVNVKSYRGTGTYTNSTKRSIQISLSSWLIKSGSALTVHVNGLQVLYNDWSSSGNHGNSVYLVIPPDSTYKVNTSTGYTNGWTELR